MAHLQDNQESMQTTGTLSPISLHVSSTMEPRRMSSFESSLILSADVHNDSVRSLGSNLNSSRLNISQSLKRSRDASLIEQVHHYEMKLTRQELEISNQQNMLSFEKKLNQSSIPEDFNCVKEKDRKIKILEDKVVSLTEENEKMKNDDTLLQLRNAKKENIKLKGEVDALKKLESEKQQETSQKITDLRKTIQRLENEVVLEKEKLSGEIEARSELMQKMGDYELLKRKCEELENDKSQVVVNMDFSSEHQALSHSYSVLLEKNNALQKELESLKSKHKELLAQVNSTSSEISVYSETVADLQLQNKTLKEQLTDLRAAQNSQESLISSKVADDSNLEVLELQRQIQIRELRNSQTSNKVFELELEKSELLNELSFVKQRNQTHQREIESMKLKCLQTEKLLGISRKQAAELVSLLESYRNEGVSSSAEEHNKQIEHTKEVLEEIFELCQKINKDCEISQSTQNQEISSYQKEVANLRKNLGDLEKENVSLNEAVVQLEEKLQEAQRQASQIVDPSKTKVLRLVGGSSTEAQILRDKCSELEKMIEILEAIPSTSQPSQNVAVLADEVNKLTKEKEELEKNLKRLTEVFKKKSKLFREACCHLLGYQIDMNETTRGHLYTLTPTYGGCKEDRLVFKISTSGTISLLDSPFYSTIEPSVTEYLTHYRSYPAFLSALVIKLFENTTSS